MKRSLLRTLALGASLLTAGYVVGQNKPATPAPTPAPTKQQKLVLIATLNSADANREFQSNVAVLQAQRQLVLDLNAAVEKEKDAKKKQELKKELEQRLAQLNENNDKMQKSYGFSLARNYTMEIVTSNIYMAVTEEEAAKIEKEQKDAAKKADAPKADAPKGKKK